MCDFDGPPIAAVDKSTGEISFHNVIGNYDRRQFESLLSSDTNIDVGFYAMNITGFHYRYYDGENWHIVSDNDEQYSFIRKSEVPPILGSDIIRNLFEITPFPSNLPEFPLDLLKDEQNVQN